MMAEVSSATEQNNPPTPARIEVDVEGTENESAYGEEISNYTASLTSSVLNYRSENGRSYHGYRDGNYLLPNDDKEKDRLDIHHELMLALLGRKLFLAPIGQSPQNVLDLGTGTGIWAIEFADLFPSAQVIGADLSPIQPSFVPPNVRFVIDDIEDEWVYDSTKFDFIHSRLLTCSIKDFKKLIKQAYDHTKPGGWVEFQDWNCILHSEDGSTKDTSIEQYYKLIVDSYTKQGYCANPGLSLEQWFREAGFTNIRVKKQEVPLGTWPKDKHQKSLGVWNLLQAENGFEALAMAVLTRHESWNPIEVQIIVAKTISDARNPKVHSLFDFYTVYGQRPE